MNDSSENVAQAGRGCAAPSYDELRKQRNLGPRALRRLPTFICRRLFDRQRVGWRSYAAEFIERRGGEEKFVSPVVGASCGQRVQLEQLADGQSPQSDDHAMHRFSRPAVFRSGGRIGFKRGVVARDRGEMTVPEKTQRLLTLLQPGGSQLAGLGELCSLIFTQRAVPFDPSRAQQQDVAGLKADALPIRRRLQLLRRNSVTLAQLKRNSMRGGETWEVNQDAPSRNAAPRPMMNSVACIGLVGDLVSSNAIVKTVLLMPVMPQAIPLRRGLRVEVVVNVIEDMAASPFYRVT